MSAYPATRLEVERLGEGPPVLFIHGSVVDAGLTFRKQRELAERWTLILPNRPGFGLSPPLERLDFEAEAPPLAELLGDGAHLVGHSYGGVIALLVAAQRPEAVRSLTVSEPGCLRVAAGVPVVDEMIRNGELLFSNPDAVPREVFLRYFRTGAGSARDTPEKLPEELARGVELLKRERPSWEAEIPLDQLAAADFPNLVISGGHSEAFEAVCDVLADRLGAERAVIPGRGHTVPSTGDPYNRRLERHLAASGVAIRRVSLPIPMPAASLTDDQLVDLLQRYLTILQGHPSAEEMMGEILTDDFETGFIGGQVWKGIDGLRDFLSQRQGFFDEKHTIEELLERGESDGDIEAHTRLNFFLRRWQDPSPVSEEFTGKCFHTWRAREVDDEWRVAAQMVERFEDLNDNSKRLFSTPEEGLNR